MMNDDTADVPRKRKSDALIENDDSNMDRSTRLKQGSSTVAEEKLSQVFRLDDITPKVSIPSDSGSFTRSADQQQGQEEEDNGTVVRLSYPTAEAADTACKAFDQRQLLDPATNATYTIRLTTATDTNSNTDLLVDSIRRFSTAAPPKLVFEKMPVHSVKLQTDRYVQFCRLLESDFTLEVDDNQVVVPECNVPQKNWKYFLDGRESYVFLTYPSYDIAVKAIQRFGRESWPFDKSLKRRKPLRMQHSAQRPGDVFVDGVYEGIKAAAAGPSEASSEQSQSHRAAADQTVPDRLKPLVRQLEKDFEFGKCRPVVTLPRKNWSAFFDGRETYIFLTYASSSMVRDAIREFHECKWPFDRTHNRRSRIRTSSSDSNPKDMFVAGIFLPETQTLHNGSSQSQQEEDTFDQVKQFCHRIAPDFGVDAQVPLCTIPRKSWYCIPEGRETVAFLSYNTRQAAERAIRMYDKRIWPFNASSSSRTVRLAAIPSEMGPEMVLMRGVFDDSKSRGSRTTEPASSSNDTRLCRSFAADFRINHVTPDCIVPKKSWKYLDEGQETEIVLTYPTPQLVDQAIRIFDDRVWPLNSSSSSRGRTSRLRLSRSDTDRQAVYVDRIFDPAAASAEPSSPQPRTKSSTPSAAAASDEHRDFCQLLSRDFHVGRGHQQPTCTIPKKNWAIFARGGESYVFLTYPTLEIAEHAIQAFDRKMWPFTRTTGDGTRKSRVQMNRSEINANVIHLYGVFLPGNDSSKELALALNELKDLFTIHRYRPECRLTGSSVNALRAKERGFVSLQYKDQRMAQDAAEYFQTCRWPKSFALQPDRDTRAKVRDHMLILDQVSLRTVMTATGDGMKTSEPSPSSVKKTSEEDPVKDRIKRFMNSIIQDFKIDGVMPTMLTLPKKNWPEFTQGLETSGFLSYPTRQDADKAIAAFNARVWPFMSNTNQRTAQLSLSASDISDDIVVIDGIFDLEHPLSKTAASSAAAAATEPHMEQIEGLFPKAQAVQLVDGETALRLHFESRQDAQEAVDLFWTTDWPEEMQIQTCETTRIQVKSDAKTVVIENIVRLSEWEVTLLCQRDRYQDVADIDEFLQTIESLTESYAAEREADNDKFVSFFKHKRKECDAFLEDTTYTVHSWSNWKRFCRLQKEMGLFQQFMHSSDPERSTQYMQQVDQRLDYDQFKHLVLSYQLLQQQQEP